MRGISFCINCMTEAKITEACPNCGYDYRQMQQADRQLRPGTELAGKYIIGRVLGQGGHGITYLAWDINLSMKLAVKEYMPIDIAYRMPGDAEISIYKDSQRSYYDYGLQKFLEEARTLARFAGHPNIVQVKDYFEENRTAYIAMEYVDGITIKEYLKSENKPLDFRQALQIFLPVLDALKEIHAIDILHRDISPDNMLLDTSGRVVLIDFGAARQAISEKSATLSVIMKAGFSPEEQYYSSGNQGPWTDIYAVAASIYYSITARVPPESLGRLNTETLIPPSEMGIEVPEEFERVLLKAMSVKPEDRYQRVDFFQEELCDSAYKSTVIAEEPLEPEPAIIKMKPSDFTHDKINTHREKGRSWSLILLVFIILASSVISIYAIISIYSNRQQMAGTTAPLLEQVKGNALGNIINGGIAASDSGWIYYRSNEGGAIYRISLDGTINERINDDDSWYINVKDDWVYYRSESDGRKIFRINLISFEKEKITDDRAWYISLIGNWIYYRNQDDEDKLYRVSADGSKREKLSDQQTKWSYVHSGWIYYSNSNDRGSIYRLGIDGSRQEKIITIESDWINIDEEWIYFRNLDDAGTIYRAGKNGERLSRLTEDQSAYINVTEGWIYYCNLNDQGSIYKIGVDGKKREKINDSRSSHLNIVSGWIYYRNWSDKGKIYKIRTDGGREQLVEPGHFLASNR